MADEIVGILAKRRAQAEVVKPIYEALKKEFGTVVARRIIGDAIREAAIEEGKAFACREGEGPNLERYAALLPLWTKDDALTIEPIRQTNEEFIYRVTRCRYAEMYKEMGLSEIGDLLSCSRDGSFCEGYDPQIHLTRTQTIMQGASHCDFCFRRKQNA